MTGVACPDCGGTTEHRPMCKYRRGDDQPVVTRCGECRVPKVDGKIEHEETCSHRVQTVRDTATVTVKAPVDGTVKRRTRGPAQPKPVVTTYEAVVDPRIMEAAKAAMLPGQKLVIVSANEVWIKNR